MAENPAAAFDLPLKIIAWEDDQHTTWVAYNGSGYIRKRYSLSEAAAGLIDIDPLIMTLLRS